MSGAAQTVEAVTALRGQAAAMGYQVLAVCNGDDLTRPEEQRGKAPVGKHWQLEAREEPPVWAELPASPDGLNTGILCDGLRPIDINVDDPAKADKIDRLAFDFFGLAPVRWRSNSPRRLLLYRAAEGAALGRGQCFVAFGMHASGAALAWEGGSPLDTPVAELTAVTEAKLGIFLVEAAAILEEPEPVPQANNSACGAP